MAQSGWRATVPSLPTMNAVGGADQTSARSLLNYWISCRLYVADPRPILSA